MAVKINNIAIPSTMNARALDYKFEFPVIAKNGAGDAIQSTGAVIQWTWSYLTLSEYQWWKTTLLGEAMSKAFSSNITLYNDEQAEQNFSYVIVNRPTYGKLEAGLFRDVTLIMEQAIPA